ncbi:cytochrome P450 monooxygenase-like protein [Hortaea werneckii]|nr:cytochrome P450 monooxygenase-like protein [Hortaea werneckii]KAI7355940.1 cytochrome P450 monooxygenase-like protein [Hortaea werneckii]KAI7489845.1 cytochrome P450 monooxygenase-like protein [Hortaea werneckii]KAI7496352.1 cytochrome P450 monooxygenase-like protein [Hortaea werneckii]
MAAMSALETITPKTVALVGLTLLVAAWIVQTVFTAITSPLRQVPGPWYSLFTNQVLKNAVTGGRRIFYIDSMHQKYGPVVRISPDEVAVSDIEGFKQIHAVSSKFTKNIWYEKLTNFPRHSVFTKRDPKDHAQRRRLFARGFSKSYMRENWEGVIKAKSKQAVEKMREDAVKGSCDILKWSSFMAADIIGCVGFGESFGLLEAGQKTEYIRVLELALVGNGIGAELPWLRAILARIPAKPLQETFNSSNYILSYGKKAVENAKRHGEDSNLMAAVLAEAAKENSSLDDLDVQTEATSLIFAGSGTTANTLTYLLWCVLQRPELQRALEAEVASLNEDPSDAELEQLPLFNATIQEVLRLYCAVPGSLPRVAPAGGAKIGGYYIPEGVTCSTQAYTLHRDPASWGNPHEFLPERHLQASVEKRPAEELKNGRTTSCAFGAGAYTCLGQHMAWMELRLAAAYFFRMCKGAELGPTANEDMQLENYFVITPKGKKCEISLRPTVENV